MALSISFMLSYCTLLFFSSFFLPQSALCQEPERKVPKGLGKPCYRKPTKWILLEHIHLNDSPSGCSRLLLTNATLLLFVVLTKDLCAIKRAHSHKQTQLITSVAFVPSHRLLANPGHLVSTHTHSGRERYMHSAKHSWLAISIEPNAWPVAHMSLSMNDRQERSAHGCFVLRE